MNPLTQIKLGLGIVLACLVAYVIYSIHDHGKESGRQEIMARWDNQKAKDLITLQKANEKIASTQKTLDRDIAELTKLNIEREDHDKKIIDNLKRDVSSGDFRLRVTIKRHQAELANSASTGNGEERGELLPAITFDLLSLASRANAEVHRTNKCIDQYNEVKRAFDSLNRP